MKHKINVPKPTKLPLATIDLLGLTERELSVITIHVASMPFSNDNVALYNALDIAQKSLHKINNSRCR